MSLDILVGVYPAYASDYPELVDDTPQTFAGINAILRAARLPEHHEREDLSGDIGALEIPWSERVGNYGTIHHLRRLYAHVLVQRASHASGHVQLPAPCDGERASQDPLLLAAYDATYYTYSPCYDSHLIQHADNCGYYLPVDFPMVLRSERLPDHEVWEEIGHSLGSSHSLRRECADIAALLELDLTAASLMTPASSAFDRIKQNLDLLPAAQQPLWLREGYDVEASACWILYHGSLASLESGLALQFC